MQKQDDGLFLLEVLIDKVIFVKSPCFSDRDFRTCVNIQCPAVEPLEICDDDPGAYAAKSGGPFVKTFNSGKSCLFSLKEPDITSAMSRFPVQVTVYKSLPCGCLPTKIIMGEATIDMTKEFVQSRKKYLEDPTNVSYEALKDSFRIVGPDKVETGEIVMFLRISCFGKLIITRFQGGSGPPNLGAAGGTTFVDRSCVPRRDFQTNQDPCVCGAAQATAGLSAASTCHTPCRPGAQQKGYGICPPVPDPYDSMPCENPVDPCFCSGAKPPKPQTMECRNTHQYCLHVPKGALPSLPFYQDLKEDQIMKITSSKEPLHAEDHIINLFQAEYSRPCSEITSTIDEYLLSSYSGSSYLSTESFQPKLDPFANSLCTIRSKSSIISFFDNVNYVSESWNVFFDRFQFNFDNKQNNLFGKEEIVCTLFNDFCTRRSSGTQATASINKCFQVTTSNKSSTSNILPLQAVDWPSYQNSQAFQRDIKKFNIPEQFRYTDTYYFGNKRDMGMGSPESKSTLHKNDGKSAAIQAKSPSCTSGAQTNKAAVCTEGTYCSGRTVSIQDCKPTLPPDMIATVSHIRIGPREPCPSQGLGACIGPNCLSALTASDGQTPVTVTTATNPRRGVFEIVIRRITGAALAKNELMLEWTPPPVRFPCGPPCPSWPSKCRMITCRPPKCCQKLCRKPCGPPCRRPCGPPCRRPCGTRRPCGPPKRPCGLPCKHPCGSPCRRLCGSPCRRPCGSPCRRPCGSPCRRPCGSPCRRPCGSPCRRPCGGTPPCRRPCGSNPSCKRPCRNPCKRPCGVPCKKPCGVPCRKPPCSSPCRKPPCSSPSDSPCKSPCPSPCLSPSLSPRGGRTCRLSCGLMPCKLTCRGSPCRPVCAATSGCSRCKPSCSSPCPPPSPLPCSPPRCCQTICPPTPCKSSPCLRPCPVGYRKCRKSCSQSKIKQHRKRISPCYNRLKYCPAVRCRSCIPYCGAPYPPQPCGLGKCYGPFPFKARCCRSSCSISC